MNPPNAKLQPREIWRLLITPYWTSSDRRIGIALLVALLALVVADTAVNAWMADFNKGLFDALQEKDKATFIRTAWLSIAAVGAVSLIFAVQRYTQQWLAFRWRRGLTAHLVARWFSGNAFYRLERQQIADNPDQRISEDAHLFTDLTLELGLSFLRNLGQLVYFGHLLWVSAGAMSFGSVTIPGYMFWVALAFGLTNSAMVHWAGHRLAGLTIDQQRVEADFRYTLMQQRESAEQIAMYRGGGIEQSRLRGLFGAIAANWGNVTAQSMRMNFANHIFLLLGGSAPLIAMAPKFFAGEASLGDLMQNQMAFAFVAMCAGWFAMAYQKLFQWSAVTRRLLGLHASLALPEVRGITIDKHATDGVSTEALQLALPTGAALANVGKLRFAPGERWLVRGTSGIGKSTLMRALAGLWPHGQGQVDVPADARMMFLPQKSYIPPGSLKAAMTYPTAADTYTDAQCRQLLADCKLPHLAERLHESARWVSILSGGEQQRLVFARALLAQPEFLFLDEATSALDIETEAALYRLLQDRLPDATVVSVAHRASLDAYHDREFVLSADGVAIHHRLRSH